MSMQQPTPTGNEVSFKPEEIIVSKTDPKGLILYCNDIFIRVSGFQESELLGKPHSILRHPDMPKCIFKVWWDHLNAGEEVFAYVVNLCKNGDHYWVKGHGTPSYNMDGQITGMHSNRRVPDPDIIHKKIIPTYRELLDIERSEGGGRKGMEKAHAHFTDRLNKQGLEYNEWFFSL